jgi:hypothetical protein
MFLSAPLKSRMAYYSTDVDGIGGAKEFFEQVNSKAITFENQMAFIQ